MELTLSNNSPSNTVLSNEGQPLYFINTPSEYSRETTTIHRAVPGCNEKVPNASHELAKIEWHMWRSSQLTYNGRTMKVNDG